MSSIEGGPPAATYEQIEAAVTETVRGRWFLAEYARRRRHADTAAILDAIGALRKAVGLRRSLAPYENFETDAAKLAQVILAAERNLCSLWGKGGAPATGATVVAKLQASCGVGAPLRQNLSEDANVLRRIGGRLRASACPEDAEAIEACAGRMGEAARALDPVCASALVAIGALGAVDRHLHAMMQAADLPAEPSMVGLPATAGPPQDAGPTEPRGDDDHLGSDTFSFYATAA